MYITKHSEPVPRIPASTKYNNSRFMGESKCLINAKTIKTQKSKNGCLQNKTVEIFSKKINIAAIIIFLFISNYIPKKLITSSTFSGGKIFSKYRSLKLSG